MNKNSTTIYLVRHGEVDWNVKGLVLGQKDFPLNQKGRRQAKKLAKTIANTRLDAIFSSDLMRAKETAEVIAHSRNLTVKTSKALREQTFGRYEGWDKEKFINLFDKWNEMSDEERHKYTLSEDVESNENAVNRLINFIRRISNNFIGKTILIVTHGAIMRYLLIQLGYASYDYLSYFDNTGYIKLEIQGSRILLKEVKGFNKE